MRRIVHSIENFELHYPELFWLVGCGTIVLILSVAPITAFALGWIK